VLASSGATGGNLKNEFPEARRRFKGSPGAVFPNSGNTFASTPASFCFVRPPIIASTLISMSRFVAHPKAGRTDPAIAKVKKWNLRAFV
jgi:hypothetical protein